jgi:hypothetical protein
MSYDIYFVRRDPGQTFQDALDELEDSFEGGDPAELTESDLENWETLVPLAKEILGDVEVDETDETRRELTAVARGIDLHLINGEVEIHVTAGADTDSVDLMETVYELARAVEEVTGLEGYDPQVGEPVSDQPDAGTPSRRRWSESDDDDEDDDLEPPARATGRSAADADLNPYGDAAARRWWEFWKP